MLIIAAELVLKIRENDDTLVRATRTRASDV